MQFVNRAEQRPFKAPLVSRELAEIIVVGDETEKHECDVVRDSRYAVLPGCARRAEYAAFDATNAAQPPPAGDDSLDQKIFEHVLRR